MADVRSLLRQHRAVRRIDHPQAAYSDAGKLLCLACHEPIKADALWEAHLRSVGHRQRATEFQYKASSSAATEDLAQSSHKRKHSATAGDDDDNIEEDGGPTVADDAVRKKRSKPDMTAAVGGSGGGNDSDVAMGSPSTVSGTPTTSSNRREAYSAGTPQSQHALTPPLMRRASGTPVQGVEMQIPSRPATPNPPRDSGGNSTPIGLGVRHSPLVQQLDTMAPGATAAFAIEDAGSALTPAPVGTAAVVTAPSNVSELASQESVPSIPAIDLDEDEWAAFEAEVVNAPPPPPPAAAVEKEEQADRARRRAAAEAAAADEREEASRALETEFDEMEELEARVRRLKERREALRMQGDAGMPVAAEVAYGGAAGLDATKLSTIAGKENAASTFSGAADPEDDEDYDEDDDWDSFRFRR